MGRDGTEFRRVFEKAVGWYAVSYRQIAQAAEHGELFQVVTVSNLHPSMLGEEHAEDLRILPGDLVTQL